MPELAEQMYCSEQICIPPAFPYLLRQFAKAAIRTQPTDLLKWALAYFRCLSLNIPPPVKPRLEYPIPRDHYGITPGWLKALMYQLQNNLTVPFKILWDRWTGACLEHQTLIQILCLGGFTDPFAIPWLRFVGLCAAHLTDDLTHSMILICEIMSEEPEGGSAMITLETFVDLYRFLANIDASKPQVLKNIYFMDSLLGLWAEEKAKVARKEVVEEVVAEEESEKTVVSEESEEEVVRKVDSKEVISCPSIAGDDDYSMDYYVDAAKEEGGEGEAGSQEAAHEEQQGGEGEKEEAKEGQAKEEGGEGGEGGEEKGEEGEGEGEGSLKEEHAEEEEKLSPRESDELLDEAKDDVGEPTEGGTSAKSETYTSVDTIIEEPRKIVPDRPAVDEEELLNEDLERLKSMQEAMAGETDDELEKYKCKLIAEMPLSKSREAARRQYGADAVETSTVEESTRGEEEVEGEGKEEYEDVYVDAIPGIGPIVPEELVRAVCEYMRGVSIIQHGMVMPRNVKHYNCPPLEVLQY